LSDDGEETRYRELHPILAEWISPVRAVRTLVVLFVPSAI